MDWSKLSGWKTNVGMGLLLVAAAGRMFAPQEEAYWAAVEKLGYALGGVGLLHKGVKGEVFGKPKGE